MKLPALDPSTLTPRTTSTYPKVFQERVMPREKRALGNALGLAQFGVNLTTLFPGKASSLRHFHSHEEEFVYLLEGEVVLITDEGEQTLTAGMCAGFRAGTTNGHQLINRSDAPAKYLEVGSRHAADQAKYPEDDLRCEKNEAGAWVYAHRDGTPWD